jgi:hypothetical protein
MAGVTANSNHEYLHVSVVQYPEMTSEEAINRAAAKCGPELFKKLIGRGKVSVWVIDFTAERSLAIQPVVLPHHDFMVVISDAEVQQ